MVGILESEDLEAAAGQVTISSSHLTPGIVMKKTPDIGPICVSLCWIVPEKARKDKEAPQKSQKSVFILPQVLTLTQLFSVSFFVKNH